MFKHLAACLLAATTFACATEPAPQPPAIAAEAHLAAAIPAPLDMRDQYMLARDIQAALSADEESDPLAAAHVMKGWRGSRVRWELRYLPALCARHDRCVVAPFDHHRFDKRLAQGWLPQLDLTAAQHQAMRSACADHLRCVVQIEARIGDIEVSPELPTRINLDRVSVVSARQQRSDESWVVARSGA